MPKSTDGIFTRKDRPGAFYITWTDAQGRRRKRKTNAKTYTQAKQARSAELVKAEQAKVLGFSAPGEETFAEVSKSYLAHQKARLTPAAYERERGALESHLKPFFAFPVRGIRRVDIQRYITKRSGDVKAETVRKELNILKHLLKLAVEWEMIPVNPAQGVKGPKAPAGRVRYLQQGELEAVILACPDWLRPIALIAVSTGMRRSEILKLRWLDVDLLNKRLMLPQTKNGEGRIVYLNNTAETTFRMLAAGKSVNAASHIFPGIDPLNVSVAFTRACRKVNISDFHLHDLRHHAASWLRMSGADVHTVAQLLGHKDLRMAIRYQHLSPAYLADAVCKLDAVIGGVLRPQSVPTLQLPEKGSDAND
jgi:integrase